MLHFTTKFWKNQKLIDLYNRFEPLIFNYFTQFLTGLVSLFITSKMSFLFTPLDINNYEQIISFATIFVTISIWGYDTSAIFDETKKSTKNYLSISLMLLLNFFILLILTFTFNYFFHWFKYLNVILLITATNLTFSTLSNMMTYSGSIKIVNQSNILFAFARIILILIFIIFFDKHIEFWLYSLVIGNLFGIIYLLTMSRTSFFNGIYKRSLFFLKYIKYTKIGLLLILPQLLSIFSDRFGRIFVSYHDASIASASYQLAQSTSLILYSINIGYSRYFASHFFTNIKDNGIVPYINSHLKPYLFLCIIGVFICLLFWKYFIDEKYSSNMYNTLILLLLIIVSIIDGLIKFFLFSLNYLKKYKLVTIYMILFLTTYVLLAFLLNKNFHALGIVISSLFANIFLLLLVYKATMNESKN